MSDPIRLPVGLDGQTDKGPIILEQAAPGWEERKLEVNVIFTTTPGTLAALRLAGQHACDLRGRINILVVQVVPYPLPLENPLVTPEFTTQRYRTLAADQEIETRVEVYLCRNPRQPLLRALKPNSLVVIGGRKRRWPTREQALARILRSHGHQVIFVDLK
jgi:hypothetical protein